MIIPTVGRIMLYFPDPEDNMITAFQIGDETHAAIVCYVHDGTVAPSGSVNLAVFDRNGVSHSYTAVTVVQEGDAIPERGGYATWMAYQKAVAAGALPPAVHGQTEASPPAAVATDSAPAAAEPAASLVSELSQAAVGLESAAAGAVPPAGTLT